ncbi:DUF4145 domain-containing protein [Streptomyces sp. NPDC047023]|uniref:DUF4145 domain-containing protein n=1 Tax=Streptomyces sp. NPDC047023 TaxID=3155139 RepID=UPI0033C11B07
MANQLVQDLHQIAQGLSSKSTDWPHIPCPTCKRSSLTLVEGSLDARQATTSAAVDDHPNWEVEWHYGSFSADLRCPKSTCDLVRVVGRTSYEHMSDPEFGPGYEQILTPLFFLPELPLIESFGNCPDAVRKRIEAASTVIWADPSSAANRLRTAVECLMDEFGIQGGTLHSRIEKFKKSNPNFSSAANLMLAVKWGGNVGTHDSILQVTDVLNIVEILERTLHEIYDTTAAEIQKKADGMIARKGIPASQID